MDGIIVTSENNKIEIYPSIRKLISLIFIALIFVVIGSLDIIYGFSKMDNKFIIINGIIVVLFFGFCFICLVYRLIVKNPIILIDEKGIIDNASFGGIGLIKWNEIKEVIIYTYFNQKFLGIIPYDIDHIEERLCGFKKFLFKLNRNKVMKIKAPINIPQNITNIKIEHIKETMELFKENNVSF